MVSAREVVVTGLGVATPIGLGREAFWSAIRGGQSGVRPLEAFDARGLPVRFGGEVQNFDAKQYVTPRKSLKVMSREIQLGFTAARMACDDARLAPGTLDPDRCGVIFGADMIYCEPTELISAFRGCIVDGKFDFVRWGGQAMREMYPLWLLKYLPNMPACHIAIARDARGPNNSITLGEVSSLLALAEATRVIERDQADMMIAGGTGSRIHPMVGIFKEDRALSHREDDPASACRPFDRLRDGMVQGEGSAAFVLESRRQAEARGAPVLARIHSYASTFEPRRPGQPLAGTAIRTAIRQALSMAGLSPRDIGQVNGVGLWWGGGGGGEAQAIRDLLGDVPVTAPKSYFGNLGAGTGAAEMAASVLGFAEGLIPPTLNYQHADPACPINVVHGSPAPLERPYTLLLNQTTMGQSVAAIIARP